MVKTRKMRKSRARSYARRLKRSPCRRKGPAVCRSTSGCKYVGKRRHFCRKSKNTRRHRGGSRRRRRRMRGGEGFGMFRRA